MAELTPIQLLDAYTAGALTDQVFTSMAASTTVRITGKEIFIFKDDDDLGATFTITSVATAKAARTGDISIVVAAGGGKYGIWFSNQLDGFKNSSGFVTIPAVANGEMMVLRLI